MGRYILDTTVLIDLQRRFSPTMRWVQQRIKAGDSLALTPPVVAEFLSGLPVSTHRAMVEILQAYELLVPGWEASQRTGELLREYRERGITLALSDALTGALARQGQWVIATSNERHFPYAATIDPRTTAGTAPET